MLSVQELQAEVAAGRIDTVLVAIVDMQGRLQGKRCTARHFVDEVLPRGTGSCSSLLAVDVDMNTVGGYAMSSWDTGYGDLVMKPDLTTLRRVPWQEGTALVLCDTHWEAGDPVTVSPRHILHRQLERLGEYGVRALVGTELEFIVFNETYEQAWNKVYRGLQPSNQYNIDYSLLGTARVEPLLRDIRNSMQEAGMLVESAKGESNPGQHEVTFRYAEALTTCDNHSIFKGGAKEIASNHGKSLSFMAKYDEREGNSCHIHLSLRDHDNLPVFAGDRKHGFSEVMEHFLAGQLAGLRELTYLLAPNINSYKRFTPGSFAPTTVTWGRDNRTCALRVVGQDTSLRFENRVPGGDVNPYLAVAALIAAGLHGLENRLELEEPFAGNAYTSGNSSIPATLRVAAEAFADSKLARDAFGDEVVNHYLNAAEVELTAFDAAVTDWERIRGFERL